MHFRAPSSGLEKSYARKLVTVLSGSIDFVLDSVAEFNPLDDFGQAVLAIKFAHFFLADSISWWVMDLSRFRSGLLRAILAIKESGYGSDTRRRVQFASRSPAA